MRLFWDSLLILTITVWILGLTARGYIPEGLTAVFLLLLVFFVVLIRAGGSIGRLARMTFRIALPIASLVVLSIILGAGSLNDVTNVLFGILTIFVMLIGFYIMVSGPFSSK